MVLWVVSNMVSDFLGAMTLYLLSYSLTLLFSSGRIGWVKVMKPPRDQGQNNGARAMKSNLTPTGRLSVAKRMGVKDAAAALQRFKETYLDGERLCKAKEFLHERLRAGPMHVNNILQEAKRCHIVETTLKQAKKELRITSRKRVWALFVG
jgi:hypothetical protein